MHLNIGFTDMPFLHCAVRPRATKPVSLLELCGKNAMCAASRHIDAKIRAGGRPNVLPLDRLT